MESESQCIVPAIEIHTKMRIAGVCEEKDTWSVYLVNHETTARAHVSIKKSLGIIPSKGDVVDVFVLKGKKFLVNAMYYGDRQIGCTVIRTPEPVPA